MRSGWKLVLTFTVLLSSALAAGAQDRQVVVAADPALESSGLMAHLAPRFLLKTRIRVLSVPFENAAGAGGADVLLAPVEALPDAAPALRDEARTYAVRSTHENADAAAATYAARFVDWLTSEIGGNTVAAFAPGGTQIYFPATGPAADASGPAPTGDAVLGEKLSLTFCGRCHVVGPQNRMKGLGSTPSFGVMRTFADWEVRFSTFYLLNPHPSFTQIADVTEPFDEGRPPPIIPLEMTMEHLEAIMAYVTGIDPADLGAPIRHQ